MLYLDGLGELLGPARVEQPGAKGFGVRGGAPGREAHGVDRRESAVQEAGEESGEVGVAAPDWRDGLDLRARGPRRRRPPCQVRVSLAGRYARVRGAKLLEAGEARMKSPSSIKSKPTTLSASCWFGLTSEGLALSTARSTGGGESTTV